MRSLVLSGGGVKGAYCVGVLKYLMSELKLQYPLVTGTSIGALNAAVLGMYSLGEESQAVDKLEELWRNLNNEKIFTSWYPLGVLNGLWSTSLFSSRGVRSIIDTFIDFDKIKKSNRKVVVGTVSLNTGEYVEFDSKHENFRDAVLASAAFPGIFEPVCIDNQLFIDGGLRNNISITTAINQGATCIDAVICFAEKEKPYHANPGSVFSVIKRSIEIMQEEIVLNDLDLRKAKNIIEVKQNLHSVHTFTVRPDAAIVDNFLDFSKKNIDLLIESGYRDAIKQYPDILK